jgi:hypothetical protein
MGLKRTGSVEEEQGKKHRQTFDCWLLTSSITKPLADNSAGIVLQLYNGKVPMSPLRPHMLRTLRKDDHEYSHLDWLLGPEWRAGNFWALLPQVGQPCKHRIWTQISVPRMMQFETKRAVGPNLDETRTERQGALFPLPQG